MICDNKSVGVIIEDEAGNLLLLRRGRYPVGIAPVAGHVDSHGSPVQAALDEVQEELGLNIQPEDLRATKIQSRRVENVCRRVGGTHHDWWVFKAHKFSGELHPDEEETLGARWYSPEELRKLAAKARALENGSLGDEEFAADPGLEKVWLDFLVELGYLPSPEK